MMRLVGGATMIVVLATAWPTAASAQATCGSTDATTATCSPAGVQVTTTVQKIVQLTVSPTSATLTAPTEGDFATGGTTQIENQAAQTVTVRANTTWAVTLTGSAWTAPYAKAVGDLAWTMDGTTWTPMTTSAANVDDGDKTTGTDITLGYRTDWDLSEDVPGTYTMPLTLTISSN